MDLFYFLAYIQTLIIDYILLSYNRKIEDNHVPECLLL
jgi:hypothetical protein